MKSKGSKMTWVGPDMGGQPRCFGGKRHDGIRSIRAGRWMPRSSMKVFSRLQIEPGREVDYSPAAK
jgi:hypothetical protein